MRHFYPDKRSVSILQIITAVIGLIIYMVIKYFIGDEKKLYFSGTLIIFICTGIIAVYLPLYFSSLRYTATGSEIIRTSGVFFKIHQSVRYTSIQYAAVIKTFLSEYTGFNFIIFFVLGGRITLLFLSRTDADEILKLSGSIYRGGK